MAATHSIETQDYSNNAQRWYLSPYAQSERAHAKIARANEDGTLPIAPIK
jgi:hypothetical protein